MQVASIGHVAVGMAAARICRPGRFPLRTLAVSVLLWSALSLLPDADVIGFSLGVRYGDPWGHRGATHSLAFAVLTGAAVGAAAAGLRLPPVRTGAIAIGVLASHPLLDTLTDGGLGCALFWPFDLTRYFAPWNPIPVAPIGLAFFSPFGLAVAATEFVQFSPLFAWAWSPEGFRALWARHYVAVMLWMTVVLILVSPLSGSIRETATGLVLREDTEYAQGIQNGSSTRFIEAARKNRSVRFWANLCNWHGHIGRSSPTRAAWCSSIGDVSRWQGPPRPAADVASSRDRPLKKRAESWANRRQCAGCIHAARRSASTGSAPCASRTASSKR